MSSGTNSAVSKTSLSGLPLELREQIYHHYFKADGGYVYDGTTDTLTQTDGKPVDIALRYACRFIAHETRDYPFQLNSIKFSTVYRDDWQEMAGSLIWTMHFHKRLQMALLEHLRDHITPDMYRPANPQYLEYMPEIKNQIDKIYRLVELRPGTKYSDFWQTQEIQQQRGYRDAGEDHQISATPRTMRKYYDETIVFDRTIAYLLRILAERHPDQFDRAVDLALPGWTDSHRGVEVLDLAFKPWAIPSLSEVTTMTKNMQLQGDFDRFTSWGKMGPDFYTSRHQTTKYQYRKKAFFSAASVAIRFLNRVPKQHRLNMRKIILDENRPSVTRMQTSILSIAGTCGQHFFWECHTVAHRASLSILKHRRKQFENGKMTLTLISCVGHLMKS